MKTNGKMRDGISKAKPKKYIGRLVSITFCPPKLKIYEIMNRTITQTIAKPIYLTINMPTVLYHAAKRSKRIKILQIF